MIEIKINSKALQQQLIALAIATAHRQPMMHSIAASMHAAVLENFRQAGRPRWLGLKYRHGKPLNDKGVLRRSINQYADNDNAVVGTNLAYAAIHQFGGKTKAHLIKPVIAKALYFNGRFAKSVKHPGSRIAARPFLQLTDADKTDIIDDVQKYLQAFVD